MRRYFAGLWSGIARVEKASDLLPELSELDEILRHAETLAPPGEFAERVKAARAFHSRCVERAEKGDGSP
jgi:hypothetical protein